MHGGRFLPLLGQEGHCWFLSYPGVSWSLVKTKEIQRGCLDFQDTGMFWPQPPVCFATPAHVWPAAPVQPAWSSPCLGLLWRQRRARGGESPLRRRAPTPGSSACTLALPLP